jgi:hypothetical protein
MKRFSVAISIVLALALPSQVLASSLQEFLFNLNGTTFHNTAVVPGLDSAGFDFTTGLGTLVLRFSPGVAGAYFFDVFFDHQVGTPFYDEYGAVSSPPGAGISWQIDEPGFGDGNRLGTIFTNAMNNTLDNTNHVPGTLSNFSNNCGGNTPPNPPNPACNNDVSMAMGFKFVLAADEAATITLTASNTTPPGGFFIRQIVPNTGGFGVALTGMVRTGSPVPEPASVLLLGIAGISAALVGRRLRRVRSNRFLPR